MKLNEIKELILTIDRTSINKFDIQIDNFKLSIEKGISKEKFVQKDITIKEDIIEEINEDNFNSENNDLHIVNAPLIGTFYGSASPDSPSYVSIGSKVKKGDTLCILEAMKLMNEIQSEVDGEIIEILAKNEELVEYGQPLFKIREF